MELNVFLQDSRQSLGVRMALGETQIVNETRDFLIENGVALDAFSQVKHKNCSCKYWKIFYFSNIYQALLKSFIFSNSLWKSLYFF